MLGHECVDEGDFSSDDVEGDAEFRGCIAHGEAVEDAGVGDGAALCGPGVAVSDDELEAVGDEACGDAADACADGSRGFVADVGDLPGGEAVAVDGPDEFAIGGCGVSGVRDDGGGDVSGAFSAEVEGVIDGDVGGVDVDDHACPSDLWI